MELTAGASLYENFPALDNLPWRDDPWHAVSSAAKLLSPPNFDGEAFLSWYRDQVCLSNQPLHRSCIERPSHFKWYVGGADDLYCVWIHQYKDGLPPDRKGSFASSTHNHRYSFASHVARGRMESSNLVATSAGRPLHVADSPTFVAGDVYTITSDRIHRIDQTSHGTVTIVVQGPIEKTYSLVYDPATGESQRIDDLTVVHTKLLDTLG